MTAMRFAFCAVAAAALSAAALVRRQDTDFGLIDSFPRPELTTVQLMARATTVSVDTAAATSLAIFLPLVKSGIDTSIPVRKRDDGAETGNIGQDGAEIKFNFEPDGDKITGNAKDRTVDSAEAKTGTASTLAKRDDYEPQPQGLCPLPDLDTPAAFIAFPAFSQMALAAATPAGYNQTYRDLKAASSAYMFIALYYPSSYDPAECAAECDHVLGCSGFNIYFERAPAVEPRPAYPNPPSTTAIKCVLWGGYVGPVNKMTAVQKLLNFTSAVAGSNAYLKAGASIIPGFTGQAIGNAAIRAPLSVNGEDTYLGAKLFTMGFYDPGLCAAACSNLDVTCTYFVTYIGALDGEPMGQYCALYNQGWDQSYATNTGQVRGSGIYSVTYAHAYWNSLNPGFPRAAGARIEGKPKSAQAIV